MCQSDNNFIHYCLSVITKPPKKKTCDALEIEQPCANLHIFTSHQCQVQHRLGLPRLYPMIGAFVFIPVPYLMMGHNKFLPLLKLLAVPGAKQSLLENGLLMSTVLAFQTNFLVLFLLVMLLSLLHHFHSALEGSSLANMSCSQTGLELQFKQSLLQKTVVLPIFTAQD